MSEAATVKLQVSEEQFPLLKMTALNIGETKIATPKGWSKRASEYAPACWISLVLVTVSIMAVLTLGTTVNKRQSLLFKLFTDRHPQRDHRIGETPADVFLHKIVQDRPISFERYSLYLSDIALKYPFLRFHVFFLIDDSQHHSLRHYDSRIINKVFKNRPERFLRGVEGESFKRDVTEFTKQYDNLNITIVPLSEHMLNSPMSYKWRSIPSTTLQFYCGVHAVWKYGGIAVDLDTFNGNFKEMIKGDDRINAIFERYNEGLGVSKEDIDRKKPCPHHEDLFSINLYSMLSSLPRSLRDLVFSNTTEVADETTTEKIIESPLARANFEISDIPHVRTHRNKREVIEYVQTANLSQSNSTLPLSNATNPASASIMSNAAPIENMKTSAPSMATDGTPSAVDINTKTLPRVELKNTDSTNIKRWTKELTFPEFVFIDIFDMEESFPPCNLWPFTYPAKRAPTGGLLKPFGPPPLPPPRRMRSLNGQSSGNRLLVADVEGRFIASAVRYHPFLGRMLFPVGFHPTPRFVFESVLSANCYGRFDTINCADVYFL